jgi:hypothetical protein
MRDFWGVVVAVGGAVTVVLSAKQQEKKLGPHEIWGAITNLEFEIYMAVTISMIAVLIWASPKYGNRTILVDLGLVGLFGKSNSKFEKSEMLMVCRWLYRSINKGCSFYAVFNTLESSDYSSHICPPGRSGWDCHHAGQICEQGTAAIRLYTGHSRSICNVYLICYYWKRDSVQRF